jgi:hypothetical protein
MSRMTLASVTRGRIEKPIRAVVYGVSGIGKTTFAANAPNPIFLAPEDGTSQLDVARFPEPKTWREAREAIRTLASEKHEYKTLVLDTADWLEPLCWEHVCDTRSDNNGKVERQQRTEGKLRESIEAFGYGKGYTVALEEWRLLLSDLETMRAKAGMHVLILAHSQVKQFKNPEGDDFDRYEMKLHAKSAGLITEWSDVVMFARLEMFANKDSKTKRIRGQHGARVLNTNPTAAFFAKNRHSLPEALPLEWSAFEAACKAGTPDDPSAIVKRIESMLGEIADAELVKVMRAEVEKSSANASRLAQIADRVAARLQIQKERAGQ